MTKIGNINNIDDDELITCVNCKYRDIAKVWKNNKGRCISCKSRAFVLTNTIRKSKKR